MWIGLTPEGPDEIENVMQFASDLNIPWPIGYGAEQTFKAFGVQLIPALYVIDRAGRIAWTGDHGPAFEEALRRALADERPAPESSG